jgi:hypothetical protein
MNMKIIKLSDEACRALEQLGVPFEQIGVVPAQHEESENIQTVKHSVQSPPEQVSKAITQIRPNSKEEGRKNRKKYVQHLRQNGVVLEHEERTAYLTPRGNRVVLPLANGPYRPGKWFLGTPKKFFNKPNTALILICKENEKFIDFIFPPPDVEKLVPMLTDKAGELKFNIRRDDGIYYIYRPGVDKMEIGKFLGGYTYLKGL